MHRTNPIYLTSSHATTTFPFDVMQLSEPCLHGGMTFPSATLDELDAVQVKEDATDAVRTIRNFSLSVGGHRGGMTIRLSSLGASITHILLPKGTDGGEGFDDVVLGYASPRDMWDSGNPAFLGCVVGRVANRVREGRLQLPGEESVIQLDINNAPNHLHGGFDGFGRRIWNAELLSSSAESDSEYLYPAVRFSLLSPDNDQHYPGSIHVTATYSLHATSGGAVLRLKMEATLLENSRPSPINLAQHSYFNLSRHDDAQGILDHKLTLHADSYTPLDATSIPTRQVVSVKDDAVMDWTGGRLVRDALVDYGREKANLSLKLALDNLSRSRVSPELALAGSDSSNPGTPYGFDHNYVVTRQHESNDNDPRRMSIVGILEHASNHRRLTVRSNAPGVQLYTSNFLDGISLRPEHCKEGAVYRQWQGVCLETQSFPDSIRVDTEKDPDFSAGKCQILTPEEPHYVHIAEYEFTFDTRTVSGTSASTDLDQLRGSDTNGQRYASIQEMWESQGVSEIDSSDWYDRGANYYEENCDATIDGVLGGFASISEKDLEGSRQFVLRLEARTPTSFSWSFGAACECGAGIGRVTKGLLSSLGFPRCDLVEASARLISAAPDYIGEDADKCRFYCSGLQDWEPSHRVYSLIWIQWTLCYLTDYDAVKFLKRCGKALVDGGFVCIKENTCADEGFVLDVADASVTRSIPYLKSLASEAGLVLVEEILQTTFPSDIYPVPMLAFQPKK